MAFSEHLVQVKDHASQYLARVVRSFFEPWLGSLHAQHCPPEWAGNFTLAGWQMAPAVSPTALFVDLPCSF